MINRTRAATVVGIGLLCGGATAADTVPSSLFPGQVGLAPQTMSAEAADVNDDGLLDLVVMNPTSGPLEVRFGDGYGAFGPPLALPTLAPGIVFHLGDLNADGHVDLVESSYLGKKVMLAVGVGDGGFVVTQQVDMASNPAAFDLGDLDEDGDLDLAFNLALTDQIALLLGNGDGSVTAAPSLPTVDVPAAVFMVDMTGEGHLDLVVSKGEASTSAASLVVPGNGDGTLGAPLPFSMSGTESLQRPVDVNADAIPDLISIDRITASVLVRLNLGAGLFAAPIVMPCGAKPTLVRSGDLDANGRPDLVVTDEEAPVAHVLLSLPGDTFSVSLLPVSYKSRALFVSDLTGDGRLDVTTLPEQDLEILVRPGLGDGSFDAASPIGVPTAPMSQLSLADLNGDGRTDAVACLPSQDALVVLLQVASPPAVPSSELPVAPAFEPGVFTAVGDNPVHLAVGDLDLDGVLDVVTANASAHTLTLLHGAGDGSFDLLQTYPGGPSPDSLAIGDVTGDGLPDVVVCERFSDQLGVLRSTGRFTFLGPALIPSGGHVPVAVAIADMNLDGRADVVVPHQSDTVVLRLGLPAGGLGSPQVSGCVNSPANVAVADLTGDGWPDLCFGGHGNGGYVINAGGGFLGPPTPFEIEPEVVFTPGGSTRVAAADLDADGVVDIAVTHGNELTLLSPAAAGDSAIVEKADYAFYGSANDFCIGDLDGDGSLDLVAPGSNGAAMLALLNRAARQWCDLGHGLPSATPAPKLVGTGTLLPGGSVVLALSEAKPASPAALVVGLSQAAVPFKGGLLVPAPTLILMGLLTSGSGGLALAATWPASVPAGVQVFFQMWVADAGGPAGFAGSNAIRAQTP